MRMFLGLILSAALVQSASAASVNQPGTEKPEAALTNLTQVLSLPPAAAQESLPVSIVAWVVAIQPDSGVAWLRDATGGWEFQPDRNAPDLRVGMRIRLTAQTCWNEGRAGMDVKELRVVEKESPPQPINLGERALSAGNMLWAETEGVVAFIGDSGQELVMDLSDHNQHLTINVTRARGADVVALLHQRIRVRGVAQAGFTDGGQVIYSQMWVNGLEAIHLVDPSVQDWGAARPVAAGEIKLPSMENSQATVDGTNGQTGMPVSLGSLVTVSGRVEEARVDGYCEIADNSGGVLVDLPPDQPVHPGEAMEVLGILGRAQARPAILCGCFRPLVSGGNPLPLLTTIEQIHRLKPEEAARGYPVRVRGVATGGYGYIQDETRGISVSNVFNQLIFGGYYQIEGVTGSGLYAPVICPTKITYLGPGQLPEPIHPTWEHLASGSAVCQWLELQGLVLSATTNRLTLAIPGGRVEAEVQGAAGDKLARLENAVIRIRGTCRSEYNARRQLTRFWIDVPGPAFINVEDPAQPDAFDVKSRPLAEILQFDVDAYQVRRIKVSGQITYHAGQTGYLTDGTNGLKYFLKSSARLHPGDLVEMVGFPDAGDFSPVLRGAIWRRTGHAGLPPAPACRLAELSRGDRNALRVRVKGRVLDANYDLTESVLALSVESKVVTVRVRSTDGPAKPFVQVGSLVELTGICARLFSPNDSLSRTNSFELLVQSPGDIKVLEQPSWWTFRHSLQVVGMLGASLLVTFGWIYLLRAKVAERTRQLREQMLETERTERQRALEQERSRIARDLHDNLGSCLTEISMLAETGHNAPPDSDSPRNRFGQILNRAHTLVNTLDETVWAVDPAKDTLPSLVRYLAGFAEEFVSAAGISCRVDVPAAVPNRALTTDLRHDLFLATKEALNNAVRHAQAKEVLVQIHLTPTEFEIRVTDNGRGFDSATPSQGHGLRNLHERMSGPDRRCEITSRSGSGTTVLLAITLPAEDIAAPA